MPTNLPPEYFKVEEEYKAAKDHQEKLRLLEELISTVPKHKGTDKLRADLRRKLSKMRTSSGGSKAARHETPYHIDREGAGQVVVCGPANTGKSALVDALTNAEPEVQPYPFSTWGPTPGMVQIENIQAQLIDTPALDRDFEEPELVDLIRRCDLALIMLDLQDFPLEQLEWTLSYLAGHNILPAHLQEGEPESRRVRHVPMMLVVNKVDQGLQDDFEVFEQLLDQPWEIIPISVQEGWNLDALRWAIFDALDIMRVYSKAPGREPDLNSPFILPQGTTVVEFAGMVHQDFAKNLKAAKLWGSSEFDGQLVARDHVLRDGDIVELKA
ncbi:MAG: TGS domain-containing protein [Anaerolineales bacterium]